MFAVAALAQRGGPLDTSNADARVQIQLRKGATVDAARQEITQLAASTWQGTRVGEQSESDDQVKVVIAMPGANLDGAVSTLRRYSGAESVQVTIDVEPEQLELPKQSADDGGSAAPAESVRLEVDISESSSAGPWVTVVVALLVLAAALVALVYLQRHSGGDEDPAA